MLWTVLYRCTPLPILQRHVALAGVLVKDKVKSIHLLVTASRLHLQAPHVTAERQ